MVNGQEQHTLFDLRLIDVDILRNILDWRGVAELHLCQKVDASSQESLMQLFLFPDLLFSL